MTKLLNLDELASTENKVIKLFGKEHVAKELTVQGYIDRVARAKAVGTADTTSNVDQAIDIITEVFPTLTRAMLGDVPLAKLDVIIQFALAAPEDIEKAATNQTTSAANGDAPQGNA